MSDQESSNPTSDNMEIRGGWSRPQSVRGWQHPAESQAPSGERGWQVVPAMPGDLSEEPAGEGSWHLPSPEDTPFAPDDTLEILPRPEHTAFPTMLREATASLVEAGEDDEDESDFGGLGELVALVNLVERQPEANFILTPDAAEAEEALSPADEIEAALNEATAAPPTRPEDEVLDFTDQMAAEREALNQATGRVPYVPLTGLDEDEPETDEEEPADAEKDEVEQGLDEAEAPISEAIEDDPAAYARRQLEQLEDSQQLEQTESLDVTHAEAGDAADYARRQLEQLGGAEAIEEEEPVDAEREALAQRFLETEAQVRGLRMRHQSGQITRDELQSELRKLLILDDNQNWWMMGVDTDTWYRYDNQVNDWVQDTPPRPTARPSRGLPTETSSLNPVEVLGDQQLPYLPDDVEVTSATGEATLENRGDWMPLPRVVPINDPEVTVPGMGAVSLDDVRRSDAQTLEGLDRTVPGATIPHDAGVYVPAPGPDDAPPQYDISASGETYEDAVETQRRTALQQALLIGSLIIGGLFVLGTIFVIYIIISYNNIAAQYRQQVADLANYRPSFQTVRILDAEGQLLAELTSQDGGDRTPLNSLAQISPDLIYAVVSVEDERYFENPGYDPISIFRAFVQNIGAGQVVSGASTITQQVASRLILQDSTPTADNKLREIVIASEIARRYSKNEILLLYLNEIPFGNQSFGVEAASQFYFDKPADEIDLTEGSMLAALIGAPSARNPVTNRSEAFAQTDNALRIIATVPCLNFNDVPGVNTEYCVDRNRILNAQGDFTGQTLIQRAEVQARQYLPRETQINYPHFVFYVLEELESQFATAEIYQRGFVIRTTLNAAIQASAEESLKNRINAIELNGANNGAVMVTDPTSGAILAMVGSVDFNDPDISGQVNNVFAWNQPGSTIKPLVYAKALDGVGDRNGNGVIDYSEYLTAATILWDVPTQYTDPAYQPVNFDGAYRGPVSVRQALAQSLNVPTVKAFDFIGPEGFVEISRRLGLIFESDARGEPPVIGRPSAVGATDVRLFDMMQAYGAIANGGVLNALYSIESVTDSDGTPVVLQVPEDPGRVMRPQVAFLLQNILSDDTVRAPAFGANSVLNVSGYPGLVGAKTGTTNDIRDLWTMGFARNLVTGVWIGRVDDAPMRNLDSLSTAGVVWNQVMENALSRRQRPPGFQNPGDIVQLTICDLTGTLPGENCPGRRNELFIVNQPPAPADQGIVMAIPIDTWTFRRANDICPDNLEFRTFANIPDPFAITWLSTTGRQTANLLGLPQEIEAPPELACDLNTTLPTARVLAPADGEVVNGIIQITGSAAAQNFARYQLEYAPLGNPNNFVPITGAITDQRPTSGTVLGEWDTRNVPNGDYIIRLAMFATQQSGGGYLYRTTRVRVENIPPTPTATPTQPTATPTEIIPQATDTTIPFPTVTPMINLPTADPLNGQFIQPTVTPDAQTIPGVPTATISVG